MAHEALNALRNQIVQYATAVQTTQPPRTAKAWDDLALICECLASLASAYAQRCRALAEDLDDG